MNGFFEDLEDGLEPLEADTGMLVNRLERPNLDTLIEWFSDDAGCEATDGCWVEHDGVCEHGHSSWFLELGLI